MYTTITPDGEKTSPIQTVTYPIVEHFYTVQGEGTWAGTAAYFIRLGGCDVGCTWCDTKESWPLDAHPRQSVADLVRPIQATSATLVVITGGEPAMHDLEPLTTALHKAGLQVHLETSGAYPITGSFDWITLSPKKFKFPLPATYALAHDLKIIIFNKSDFAWAEQQALHCSKQTHLWLQPEWSRPQMIAEIVAYVKAHPQWRISLQTHKMLDIP